ncbi:MAG TPA: DUF6544 family protein [Patescibacteria group bacterium]|nr:DUF6544 family protein [Patescibacteria group bacterium]
MVRVLVIFVLVVHGLIHLLGFVKAFDIEHIGALTQNVTRPLGFLWLLCVLLFVVSALGLYLKSNTWWISAITSIVLSQVLILITWNDAKYGTIANIVILVAAIVSYGQWSFTTTTSAELQAFLPSEKREYQIVGFNDITHLPLAVQRWLLRSNLIGKNAIQIAHISQQGKMKTDLYGDWMPFTAEQYFTVKKPGFFWSADVGSSLMNFKGRDLYQGGHGHMLIKAYSIFPVVDSKGAEIDQGTLLRFMAEMIWLPSAALQDYFIWEELGSNQAKATMSYAGVTASGIYTFTAKGDFKSFDAKRYYERKSGATLEEWHVEAHQDSYKTFEGIRIPAKSSVSWKLKEGVFHWLDMEIIEVKYN